MCELFTIGTTAITVMDVVGVASAAMGAMSKMNQQRAAQNQANYRSAIARNNQIIAQQKAADALLRGREEEREHNINVEQFKGKQRSLLAGSGFGGNEDDALDILADTAQVGETDAMKIKQNAEREAWQHQLAASSAGAESALFATQSRNINPGQTGLFAFGTGMAGVADKWQTRNKGKKIFGMTV